MNKMASITYRRDVHAAHYYGGGGHDLEIYTVVSEKPIRPSEVPADAELSVGSNIHGIQTWTWTRRVPMTEGRCNQC